VPLPFHDSRRRSHAVQDAVQVHVEDALLRVEGGLVDLAHEVDAGVVDPGVDGAIRGRRLRRQRLDGVGGDVGRHRQRFAAARAAFGRDLLQRLVAPRREDDAVSARREPHRDLAADAARRSRHDHHSMLMPHRHAPEVSKPRTTRLAADACA
jgi:hypothetical protein